jgi:hypothetical protein
MSSDDTTAKRVELRKAIGLGASASKEETVERVLAALRVLDLPSSVSSPIVAATLEVVSDEGDDDVYVDGLEVVTHEEYARRATLRAVRAR